MTRQLSLRWSLGLLVVGSVLVAQLVGLAILLAFPSPAPSPMAPRQVVAAIGDPVAAERIGLSREARDAAPFAGTTEGAAGLVARTLAQLMPGRAIRVRLSADGGRAGQRRGAATPRIVSMTTIAVPPGAALRFRPSAGSSAILADMPFPAFEAAVSAGGGRWIVVGPPEPFWSWSRRVIAAFAAGLALMIPLAWASARRLTRPLERLADASELLGRNPRAPPLPVDGPAEVRAAASAFNGMQARLAHHIDQRTEMMAAIAHDLRTPLTSLRLRAEVAPLRERTRMVDDIVRMEAMTADLLAFARGESGAAAMVPVDIAALAAESVRDAVERGGSAALGKAAPAVALGDPVALRRALDNVLANGIGYGGAATVEVGGTADGVMLVVHDRGPGIPESELERVLEPFVRLEGSRSRHTGGTGLGLPIAARILAAHGGRIELSNRAGGGLAAALILPALRLGGPVA